MYSKYTEIQLGHHIAFCQRSPCNAKFWGVILCHQTWKSVIQSSEHVGVCENDQKLSPNYSCVRVNFVGR